MFRLIYYFFAVGSLRTKLCDAVKTFTSDDSFHVPLQIVQYKESDGEVFGRGFDMRQNVKTQSTTALEYDAKLLFSEAEKQGEYFLGVVGEPGVGKTYLIKSLLTHLTTDNDNCPLVFHIPIRNINFSSRLTTFQLLVAELLPDWKIDKNSEDELIETINKLCDVYILIDGLDEAEDGLFTSLSTTISLFETTTVDNIIKNMFQGRFLKNAKKLVTSRPDAFLSLHPKCKPTFNVQILGLSEESQRKLSIQICDNTDETYAKVQAKLEVNPDLAALCYIPLYCKIIVEQLKNSPESASLTHITSTHIFIQTLYEYIASGDEHLRGDVDCLLKVMELALNGIKKNKFIFSLRDYPDNEKKIFTDFLNVETNSSLKGKILDGSKQFFFVHLLWQELFAAMKLMLFADEKQFQEYLHEFSNYRWRSVVHFSYGLLNDGSQTKLAEIFGFESELLRVKFEHLKALVRQSIYTDESFDPRNHLVLPCSWAFEADQRTLTEEVIAFLPDILMLPGGIQPKDAAAISYVLSYESQYERKFSIEMIRSSTFRGKSLKLLLDAANLNGHKVSGNLFCVCKGVPKLDGAQGKNQVWHPMSSVRSFALSCKYESLPTQQILDDIVMTYCVPFL